ncbi:MAG: hypothetical protein HYW49_01125 [Deltaproteobacteria bacterium]|nr:hypothetical protein [Deltaproteobacteria bacterium]
MGPITLVDKCAIQALHSTEVFYLDRYYSLVISPILLRELLSTLAKEPEKDKDWEKTLSILANKVDTINSYVPPNALMMARANLLGGDVPMTGQIPLAGGKTVRSRDGTYGVIFEEQPEKAILRDWKQGHFSEANRKAAQVIREMDHAVDLSKLQKQIEEQLKNFPKFDKLPELIKWLDDTYFAQASQEFHLRTCALGLLNQDDTEELIGRWKSRGAPLFAEFCPYAAYFYRCNTIYFVGLGKGLIRTSKKANTHLDMQYIYYLPFCMTFTSSDKFLLEFAKFFVRPNQVIIPGDELKKDLKQAKEFFLNLTEEQKKIHGDEFGSYPPEEGAPLTSSIWNKLMAPRPKMKDAVPEFSKDRSDDIVRQINRYLKDSINIDTNRANDPSVAEKWSKVGVVERGIHFTNEALNLAGFTEDNDWNEIRKTFDRDNVKKIYDLHADMWRPDDDHWALAEAIRNDGRSKFLYLGEVEPEEIVDKVWRWSLHFDLILIPDPFHSPWSRKPEFNPLSKPIQFETDTLKLVYMLSALYPLIMAKKVAFIQDPSDFNPAMKKLFMEIAQKSSKDAALVAAIEIDKEKLKIYNVKAQMRVYSRLPAPQRRNAVESIFQTDVDHLLKHLALLREADPLCLDRDFDLKEGELILVRSGANFEASVVLSALYGATPFSSLETRSSQYKRAASPQSEHTASILKLFQETPGFHCLDPIFSSFIAEKGALSEFRDIFQALLSLRDIPKDIDVEKMAKILEMVEDDCRVLAEIYAKSYGIDGSQLVGKFPLEIAKNAGGFVTDDVAKLSAGWFPGKQLTFPKNFIRIPA